MLLIDLDFSESRDHPRHVTGNNQSGCERVCSARLVTFGKMEQSGLLSFSRDLLFQIALGFVMMLHPRTRHVLNLSMAKSRTPGNIIQTFILLTC